MLISSIRVLELDYPCDHNHYGAVKKSYEFALNISRTTRNQREFPRFVWIRRASLYQASRMRLNSFYRKRSKLDDLLIQDLCDLSLSVYLQVRRSAQRGLDSMSEFTFTSFVPLVFLDLLTRSPSVHFFDGTRSLIYDRLFDALKRESLSDHHSSSRKAYLSSAFCSWNRSRCHEGSAVRSRK